jgi:hypothetical protein
MAFPFLGGVRRLDPLLEITNSLMHCLLCLYPSRGAEIIPPAFEAKRSLEPEQLAAGLMQLTRGNTMAIGETLKLSD